jgi:hypothetical protein
VHTSFYYILHIVVLTAEVSWVSSSYLVVSILYCILANTAEVSWVLAYIFGGFN